MTPILYSFRRCPYAMRARLAVQSAGIKVELREILLRDKAPEFLEKSPSATVPCLVLEDGVLDESLEIMIWALQANDPESWLDMPEEGFELIDGADGPFKAAVDHYKYASRYEDVDAMEERSVAAEFLADLDQRLKGSSFLFGSTPSLADFAILPFVRQFAHVDLDWFLAEPWPDLARWLEDFKSSDAFRAIMKKYPKWENGDPVTYFN